MNKKLNIKKSVHPTEVIGINDWAKEFKFGSGYVKPTNYYMGNEFDASVFRGETRRHPIMSSLFNTFKFLIKIA